MAAVDIARQVLMWFAKEDPRLGAQVEFTTIGDLEMTPSGFVASLSLPQSIEPIRAFLGDVSLDGCAVFCDNLDQYADCILHLRGGRLSSLEIYSVTDGNPADASTFQVRRSEINRVDLR